MDPDHNIIEFTGFSLPEDAMGFFLPIISWLYDYVSICEEKIKENQILKVTFKFSYYNTASHRAFLEIFKILKRLQEKGLEVRVDWYYETDDNSMLESGKELSEMVDLPLNYIEFN